MAKRKKWWIDYPELLKHWDYALNPRFLETKMSDPNTKHSWRCEFGHTWQRTIPGQKKTNYCSYCAETRNDLFEKSLAKTHPKVAELWDNSKNVLTPQEVFPYSKKNAHWKCASGHEWEKEVYREIRSKGECSYCSGRKIIPGENDLFAVHPQLKRYWSEQNILDPEQLHPKSAKKCLWVCANGHVLKKRVYHVVAGFEYTCFKCPFVPREGKAVAESEDLMAYWSANNKYTPEEISIGSNEKIIWECQECGNSWKTKVRSQYNRNVCPSCFRVSDSSQEESLAKKLESLTELTASRNYKIPGSRLEIDVHFPELGLGFEFNGERWHNNEKAAKAGYNSSMEYHSNKLMLAQKADIALCFVWAHDWKTHRKEVVKEIESFIVFRERGPLVSRLESLYETSCPTCGKTLG